MKLFITLFTLALLCAPSLAQDTKADLQARFKARDAQLRELKRDGTVGETIDGYVDAVDPRAVGEPLTTFLAEENKDRRRLYQVLADEINAEHPDAKVKATPETVAARNALRNFERAAPSEFLRVAKDHWIRVKDFPRFQKLTKLKTQGKVGETPDGLVAIVKPGDSADAALTSLVKEENDARSAEYKALAAKEGVEPSVIAARMAKRNAENARIGDMLKKPDGSWTKK